MVAATSYIVIIIGALALAGCGDGGKKPVQRASDATGDIPCTEKSCPAVPLAISWAPNQGGALVAQMGRSNNWQILGEAQGSTSRDIRMKAYNPPKNAPFSGQNSLKISMTFRAMEAVEAAAPINVVIRDVSRCMHDLPQQQQACANLDQKGLERYESKAQINWMIAEGNLDSLIDPTFIQDPGAPMGANSGMVGCTQGFMSGFMGGLASGGKIMGGAMQGAMGCVGGVVGNASTGGGYPQQQVP